MKTFVIAFCIAVTVIACYEEKYTDRYDNLDMDEILKNETLYQSYFNCLKTGDECTSAGQTLRDYMPEAIATNCSRCTDIQYNKGKKLFYYMIKNRPADFKLLEDIIDPAHYLRKQYAERIIQDGIFFPNQIN